MKERYNKISTMRTFAESPAKWFMVNGEKMSRGKIDGFEYNLVKRLIRLGKMYAIQKVK